MANRKQFHIDMFPPHVVYAQLSQRFAGQFLAALLNSYALEEITNYTKIPINRLNRIVQSYFEGCKNRAFIKIADLLQLVELVKENDDDLACIRKIESNIDAIRGYGRSGVCSKPKLPIVENKFLIRIIVHLVGDGSIKREYGTNYRPSYTNSNSFLRNQFVDCLSQSFGNITDCVYHYVDRSSHSRSYIAFSQWIGYLLLHWYPDARFDEKSGSLPSVFLQLSLDLKAEMVRTFGDDDGHVGAHCIRFTSGGSTILKQVRQLIVELMEANFPSDDFQELLKSVGAVKPFRSWYVFDVYRPLFQWYSEQIGFSNPERAERLEFQLGCDRVWGERGLDGFDLDFLTLVGLRDAGSVADIARRFILREDFVFEVFQRLRKLGWIGRVEKRKFTTFYQTTPLGEVFLHRTLAHEWTGKDRVVMENWWWERLREALLGQYGTGAAVARVVGMPETTVRGYLQGRRQWMHAKWVVALAEALGWGEDAVSKGVVVAFSKKLAPRYEQCDFLAKDLDVYRRFSLGEIIFDEWLVHHRVEVVRAEQLLDAEFAEKLQSASTIRDRIIELAKARGGEIALGELKGDVVLQGLVADRYSAYVADRVAKLIKQGVFVRVMQGRYRLVQQVS
jgi:hypothetical protein